MRFGSLVSRARHPRRAEIVSLLLIPLVGFVAVAAMVRASDTPSLADLLDRAGKYVDQFKQDFALVINNEDYIQDVSRASRPEAGAWSSTGDVGGPPHREMHSEMLFVPQEGVLLAVRNVLWVRDRGLGAPEMIPGSVGRLDRALKDTSPGQGSRLRTLASEGARFNLGHIYHNFNTPILALQFLAPEFQPRFTFTIAGSEKVSGSPTVKLAFAERQPPTVLKINDKRDLLSEGWLWVRESDGAVLRTRLTIKVAQTDDGPGFDGSVNVDYRRDAKLGMWVPSRMEETYAERRQPGERIACWAAYSNFRRFETSGRLVVPE